ncbi:WHG domain-containing protein, partial [Mesorhizobium sp. M2E.F.Ca.ET.209.01.1.1]|uniref:WHG domain-containing protein n=1 Tax=Mesorhizobium sp. M2E.F.Ca.ET.209.01.1.1 TaxID=2500526 RepID=UPI001092FE06
EEHPADDPVEARKAVMSEYAAFGLGNPNESRTVFMTEKTKLPEGRSYEDMEEGNPAMKVLIKRVEACVAAGKLKGDPRAIATMLWTVGHVPIS